MRILFISATPAAPDQARKYQELRVHNDIAVLQQAASIAAGQHISFLFLPSITFGALPATLATHKPDVLHVSTHGEKDHLSLANDDGRAVPISAPTLKHMLNTSDAPRLVILSACNSAEIAKDLAKVVRMTIGFTLPVSDLDARASTVALYQGLFTGKSVQDAYAFSKHMLNDLNRDGVDLVLEHREDTDPGQEVLCPAVELVARFPDDKPPKGMDGEGLMEVEFGLANCPPSTTQVIFFTSNRYWIHDETDVDPGELSSIVVDDAWSTPATKTLWCEAWSMPADWVMFACALTGEGRSILLQSGTCDALQRHYGKYSSTVLSRVEKQKADDAIRTLKQAGSQ